MSARTRSQTDLHAHAKKHTRISNGTASSSGFASNTTGIANGHCYVRDKVSALKMARNLHPLYNAVTVVPTVTIPPNKQVPDKAIIVDVTVPQTNGNGCAKHTILDGIPKLELVTEVTPPTDAPPLILPTKYAVTFKINRKIVIVKNDVVLGLAFDKAQLDSSSTNDTTKRKSRRSKKPVLQRISLEEQDPIALNFRLKTIRSRFVGEFCIPRKVSFRYLRMFVFCRGVAEQTQKASKEEVS